MLKTKHNHKIQSIFFSVFLIYPLSLSPFLSCMRMFVLRSIAIWKPPTGIGELFDGCVVVQIKIKANTFGVFFLHFPKDRENTRVRRWIRKKKSFHWVRNKQMQTTLKTAPLCEVFAWKWWILYSKSTWLHHDVSLLYPLELRSFNHWLNDIQWPINITIFQRHQIDVTTRTIKWEITVIAYCSTGIFNSIVMEYFHFKHFSLVSIHRCFFSWFLYLVHGKQS